MQGSREWLDKKIDTVFVSGTSIQAICNEHPFRNADDVFNELVGTRPHFLGNEFSRQGQMMEAEIVKIYEQKVGKKVDTNQPMRLLPLWPNVGVSPDGVVDGRDPIEIKYAPCRTIVKGNVPLYYSGQLQLTMVIFNVDEMDFIQMDRTKNIDIIKIKRDKNYFETRRERIGAFIERVQLYRQEHPLWKNDYMRWEESIEKI